MEASRFVEQSDLARHILGDVGGCRSELPIIQCLELLADDPVRHRVDVSPDYVESESIRLKERCAAPHERIADGASQPVGAKKRPFDRFRTIEFGQE